MQTVPGSSINDRGQRRRLAALVGWGAILSAGAIFGFFYAWVCSTMWGLDAADPRVAIQTMQAMNASVRNVAFFPAFFLTPVIALIAATCAAAAGVRRGALLFVIAAVVYAVGGLGLTLAVNVPMNEELALVAVPADRQAAATIWNNYSGDWQTFNQIRTAVSGIALVLCAAAVTVVAGSARTPVRTGS